MLLKPFVFEQEFVTVELVMVMYNLLLMNFIACIDVLLYSLVQIIPFTGTYHTIYWYIPYHLLVHAVMILSFQTDKSEQTVQTQIRPLSPRGAVWSGSTLFTIPSALFRHITLWKIHISQILR